MNQTEKIALRAVKISLGSVLAVLIIGSIAGWMLLNQTAAIAQMSREKGEMIRRVENLEAQLSALLAKEYKEAEQGGNR